MGGHLVPALLHREVEGGDAVVGAGADVRPAVEEQPGGVLLSIGADDLDWIARYLAGLDLRFTVVRPA